MIEFPAISWTSIAPQTVILLTALIVLAIDLLPRKVERVNITLTALLGVVIALIFARNLSPAYETDFSGMIFRDGVSIYLDQLLLAGTALILLMSHRYAQFHFIPYAEYTVLLLFSSLGMMMISISADFITLFIGVELSSLSLYVMSGMDKSSLSSGEASVKYFLLGAFSTGFLAYGMALLFGVCRTSNLVVIGGAILDGGAGTPLLILGFALVLVGLGFKISLAPFHMWAPDVYQGAPTPVTAWIAAGSKIAGFAALLRIFSLPGISFEPFGEYWAQAIWWLAMLTMIIGNAGALAQNDIKRMLAYSSIAHGGYLSMAFTANNAVGVQALLFYLAAYLFMTLGAFAVVIAVRRDGRECLSIPDLAGLAKQRPGMAGLMAVFLFSLAGMPFT
ncbi:MAG: NADH-quinone oxidoreductase subunit N, partial [Candidatus Hinthialibacter sp.]